MWDLITEYYRGVYGISTVEFGPATRMEGWPAMVVYHDIYIYGLPDVPRSTENCHANYISHPQKNTIQPSLGAAIVSVAYSQFLAP